MKTLEIPTREQIRQEFEFIRRSIVDNVAGVWRVDSGRTGPTVGITINTHGNEPSGLAALWYLRNKLQLAHTIQKGSLLVVLNNLRATERYFRARTPAGRSKARYCDLDLNRLPAANIHDGRYEIGRAQALLKVWEQFDMAMDIHSADEGSKPMVVKVGKIPRCLIRGLPISLLVTNITSVQIGNPVGAFYGSHAGSIPCFEIETGPHENGTSWKTAMTCVKIFLQNTGLLPCRHSRKPRRYTEYRVFSSVLFPDNTFSLVKALDEYEHVTKGQVLARGSQNRTIEAPSDSHTLFIWNDAPGKTDSETLFLARKTIA